MTASGVLLWLYLKRRCIGADLAAGESPHLIPRSPSPYISRPETQRPEMMQHPETGSAQLSLGDSITPRPVNLARPCTHLLCRPWAPQAARCLRDAFPGCRGHLLPGQGRVSRGCRHGDGSANEGRRCPVMPPRFLVQERPPQHHQPSPPEMAQASPLSPSPHVARSSVQDLSPPSSCRHAGSPAALFQEAAKQQLMGWVFISYPLPMTHTALKQLPKGTPAL